MQTHCFAGPQNRESSYISVTAVNMLMFACAQDSNITTPISCNEVSHGWIMLSCTIMYTPVTNIMEASRGCDRDHVIL